MVAMFLGTALTALNPPVGLARDTTPAANSSAVADLSRYCTACWRNARLPVDVWGDCTQEVLCRLVQTIPASSWQRILGGEGEERKEFVRAIDAVKKRAQRRKKCSPLLETVPDSQESRRHWLQEQRSAVAQASAEVLTHRQRQIMDLSFEGWSVHEIASEMSLPPERVSDEKYKAIRKLRSHLQQE
jgi:RNA polymerase sigma factor (sigma-70 family)